MFDIPDMPPYLLHPSTEGDGPKRFGLNESSLLLFTKIGWSSETPPPIDTKDSLSTILQFTFTFSFTFPIGKTTKCSITKTSYSRSKIISALTTMDNVRRKQAILISKNKNIPWSVHKCNNKEFLHTKYISSFFLQFFQ